MSRESFQQVSRTATHQQGWWYDCRLSRVLGLPKPYGSRHKSVPMTPALKSVRQAPTNAKHPKCSRHGSRLTASDVRPNLHSKPPPRMRNYTRNGGTLRQDLHWATFIWTYTNPKQSSVTRYHPHRPAQWSMGPTSSVFPLPLPGAAGAVVPRPEPSRASKRPDPEWSSKRL